MALVVMGRDVVAQLISHLMAEARVVAPHRREGVGQWAFADVTDPGEVCLEYTSTILPPKKYVFLPRERLVHLELGDKPTMEAVIEAEPLVLFGVHPCDIYSLSALDVAFSDTNVDPNWRARRDQIRVVGVDCEPDEHCFCASMNTASVSEGYDLFLTPLDGEYVVEVATPAGAAMVEGLPVQEATAAQMGAVKERLARKLQQERRINCELPNLPLHFESAVDSPVWAEQAKRCHSCGTCNLTCPTCYCFNVLDEMNLSLRSGDRVREWDGCMLDEFAKVASGENFREDAEGRLRHRFFRKYSYLFTRYGRPYCCGCGRCVRQCLVHIDPVEVINQAIAHATKEA
jgi:ferredoxin